MPRELLLIQIFICNVSMQTLYPYGVLDIVIVGMDRLTQIDARFNGLEVFFNSCKFQVCQLSPIRENFDQSFCLSVQVTRQLVHKWQKINW